MLGQAKDPIQVKVEAELWKQTLKNLRCEESKAQSLSFAVGRWNICQGNIFLLSPFRLRINLADEYLWISEIWLKKNCWVIIAQRYTPLPNSKWRTCRRCALLENITFQKCFNQWVSAVVPVFYLTNVCGIGFQISKLKCWKISK
jgi:hypothetical protein